MRVLAVVIQVHCVFQFIWVRWGHFGRALGYFRVDWVNSDTSWAWSGSFGFVGLIRARSGGHSVHSCAQWWWYGLFGAQLGTLGSFGPVMVVVLFIMVRRIHSCAFLRWPGSVGLIRARNWDRKAYSDAHSMSLGTFGSTLPLAGSYGFVGFIEARSVGPRVHWVNSGVYCGWSGSFLFVGLILARPERGEANSVSLGSFGRALGFVMLIGVHRVHYFASWSWSGSFRFVGFISACTRDCRDHLVSLGSFGRVQGVCG